MVNYMQVFFIRESNKNSLFKRIFKKKKKKYNTIILNLKKEKIKQINVLKKILNHLECNKCKNVILSKEIKQIVVLKKILCNNNIRIITGRILGKNLINKILEKVVLENNIKLENTLITIISNSLEPWLKCFIESISTKCKTLSIVTDNCIYFNKLVNDIWEKFGMIITVTNNKKKSLYKSNIIINLELNEEQINNYSIYEKSIIINLQENIKIHKKRFNGKIINNFEIRLKNNSKIYKELLTEEYSYYDILDLAEVYVLNNKKEISNISIKSLK